jgi:hypothetical protein
MGGTSGVTMAFLRQFGISLVSGRESSHGLPAGMDGQTSLHAESTVGSVGARKTDLDDEVREGSTRDKKGSCEALDHYVLIGDDLQLLVDREVDDDGDVLFSLKPGTVFPRKACELEHAQDKPQQAAQTVDKSDWMATGLRSAIARGAASLMLPMKQPLLMVDVKHDVFVLGRGEWTHVASNQTQLQVGYYK